MLLCCRVAVDVDAVAVVVVAVDVDVPRSLSDGEDSTPKHQRAARFQSIPSLCEVVQSSPVSPSIPLHEVDIELLRFMDREIIKWAGLDVLQIADLMGEESVMPLLLTGAISRFNLINSLKLDIHMLRLYAEAVTYWYDSSNPYHNAMHAADCTHGVAALIAMPSVHRHVNDLEILALLLAAAVHDCGHTGQSNNYHAVASTDLSLLFSDKSSLERYHLAVAFGLMRNPTRYARGQCGLMEGQGAPGCLFYMPSLVVFLVLAPV